MHEIEKKNELIVRNFILCDNGLRCFVPPCFSWDVYCASHRKLVGKASVVVFSDNLNNVRLDDLYRNPHFCRGSLLLGETDSNGKHHIVFQVEHARPATIQELEELCK